MTKYQFEFNLLSILVFFLLLPMLSQAETTNEGDLLYRNDFFQIDDTSSNSKDAIQDDLIRGKVLHFNRLTRDFRFENNRKKEISVSFWFRPTDIEKQSGTLFGEYENYYLRYLSNRVLQFNHFYKKDINTSSFLSEDLWQHAGFSIDKQGKLAVYFNGERVISDSIASDWWEKQGDFILGNDHYDQKASGSIDDLKVWDQALSQQAFKELYSNSIPSYTLDHCLQLYLPFNKNMEEDIVTNEDVSIEFYKVSSVSDPSGVHAAYFSGPQSFIQINPFVSSHQQTITMWIKPQTKKGTLALVGNNDFSFRFMPAGNCLYYSVPMIFGLQSAPNRLEKGKWLHVAVALNYNHTIDYYINGKKFDTKPIGDRTGKDTFIKIGRSIWGNYFKGSIREFALWNRRLTKKEIYEVYSGRLPVVVEHNKKHTPSGGWMLYFTILGALFLLCVVLLISIRRTHRPKRIFVEENGKLRNRFSFFSSFYAFDRHGDDVSSLFTPTLVRMLGLIILYPKLYDRNIDSPTLSNLLWEGEEADKQKNNRSTYVHRLRTLLKRFDDIELVFSNKRWSIVTGNQMEIDLYACQDWFKLNNISLQKLSFTWAKQLQIESLFEIRTRFQDRLYQLLEEECVASFQERDWERLSIVSEHWLGIDSLSDEAIQYFIVALLNQNKKLKALQSYEKFSKNYSTLLNENYPVEFEKMKV